ANVVPQFVSLNTTAGAVKFQDNVTTPLAIGSVAGTAIGPDGPCFAGAAGITATTDITLCNTGDLVINGPLAAGAANTIRLRPSTGSVSQTAAGVLTAQSLGVDANTGILLDQAPNVIAGTPAGATAFQTGAGAVKFRNDIANFIPGGTILTDGPCFPST